jgi:glutaredoxin
MHRVRLYSRPGCHLCDQARDAIGRVRQDVDFGFEEVDIESEDALLLEYGVRIPVVAVDGVEAFEISVDEARLTALVRM